MSSKPSEPKAPEKIDYIVTVKGPIQIGNALSRKDDMVSLTEAEAQSYLPFLKRKPEPKKAAAKA